MKILIKDKGNLTMGSIYKIAGIMLFIATASILIVYLAIN